jgi:hypothetical protein
MIRLQALLLFTAVAGAQPRDLTQRIQKMVQDAGPAVSKQQVAELTAARDKAEAAGDILLGNQKTRELGDLTRKRDDLLLSSSLNSFVELFATRVFGPELLADIDKLRIDKQVGAPLATPGTTALVSRGSVPAVLGFAVENGAISNTREGTSVTFRGNASGIFDLFRVQPWILAAPEPDPTSDFLRRLSFSVSFDPTRELPAGTDPPAQLDFTGSTRQVSAWSVRMHIFNQRDPRRAAVSRLWSGFSANENQDLTNKLDVLFKPILDPLEPEFHAIQTEYLPKLRETESAGLEAVFTEYVNKVFDLAKAKDPDFETKLEAAVRSTLNYENRRNAIIGEINRLPVLAVEYLANRPLAGPSLSTLNLVGEAAFLQGRGSLTGNAGWTFFNSTANLVTEPPANGTPPAPSQLRNFFVSGEMAVGLASKRVALKTGQVVLSFAGKWERIFDGAFYTQRLGEIGVPAGATPVAVPGNLGAIQAKLVIPIPGTAVRFPLSVSYANRTELIREKELRAQFGFTFDVDNLLNQLWKTPVLAH